MSDLFIRPVVLCGGSGTRLWPLSTPDVPKQYHRFVGKTTLLQATGTRVAQRADPEFAPPFVVCNAKHGELVACQMDEVGITPAALLLEPMGRNSAPAIAVAALHAAAVDPHALLLVLPADHAIPDGAAFRRAVKRGVAAARSGRIVTLGIKPTAPETGYGYIQGGAPIDAEARAVVRFVEKPDRATAETYLASGAYLWNAGIFLFEAATMLREIETHEPGVLAAARAALAGATRGTLANAPALRLPATEFGAAPSISIDYAVLERSPNVAVVPVDFAWSDLGSWAAIWQQAEKDAAGNAVSGPAVLRDARACLVSTDGPKVALVGVDNLMVVVSDGRILIAARDRAEDVKTAGQDAEGLS